MWSQSQGLSRLSLMVKNYLYSCGFNDFFQYTLLKHRLTCSSFYQGLKSTPEISTIAQRGWSMSIIGIHVGHVNNSTKYYLVYLPVVPIEQ